MRYGSSFWFIKKFRYLPRKKGFYGGRGPKYKSHQVIGLFLKVKKKEKTFHLGNLYINPTLYGDLSKLTNLLSIVIRLFLLTG